MKPPDDTPAEPVLDRLERMERILRAILSRIDPDPVLTEREAAALRGKSVHALRKERCEGRGPRYVKDGAAVRYRRSDVLAFIEANSRETRDTRKEPRFSEQSPATEGDHDE